MPKRTRLRSAPLAVLLVVSAASQVSAACFDFPENQVPACGFETQDEINQWTVPTGSVFLTTAPVHSGSGAALLHSAPMPSQGIEIESSCFPASGSDPMGYGIYVFPVTGPVSCMAHIARCNNSDCSSCDPLFGASSAIPSGEWTLVTYGEAITNGMPFAKLILFCGAITPPSTPFEVVVDDAFWGEGMVPVTLQMMVVE
jgi:hypothetical protein